MILFFFQTDSFKLLKDNSKLNERFSKYKLPMALFNTLTLGEDVMANVKLLLPPVVEKGQKYPMIVRVYAGPGTSRVKDFFDFSGLNKISTSTYFVFL